LRNFPRKKQQNKTKQKKGDLQRRSSRKMHKCRKGKNTHTHTHTHTPN
jgi:hypothetical protein